LTPNVDELKMFMDLLSLTLAMSS